MDKYEKAALDFVNRRRAKAGKPTLAQLDRGIPSNKRSCPIAISLDTGDAISYRVSNFGMVSNSGMVEIYTRLEPIIPQVIKAPLVYEFLKRFDSFKYPHLIKPGR